MYALLLGSVYQVIGLVMQVPILVLCNQVMDGMHVFPVVAYGWATGSVLKTAICILHANDHFQVIFCVVFTHPKGL